jgi:hypothetical protein
MRQRVDADAELADLFGLLEYVAIHAARVQHQCRGEAADPAACDDRFHGCFYGCYFMAAYCVRLKHDPEKWIPVFGKDHAQTILRVQPLGRPAALNGSPGAQVLFRRKFYFAYVLFRLGLIFIQLGHRLCGSRRPSALSLP